MSAGEDTVRSLPVIGAMLSTPPGCCTCAFRTYMAPNMRVQLHGRGQPNHLLLASPAARLDVQAE
jgi:hypothetical protein